MLSKKPVRPLPFPIRALSNRCSKMPGTSRSPRPNDSAAPKMNRSRRCHLTKESTRRPEVATEANKKVVTPPSTGSGIAKKTPESLPRMPKTIRKKQHHRPAPRFAQRVMAITPLFWANTDKGVTVKSAEMKPPIPSA